MGHWHFQIENFSFSHDFPNYSNPFDNLNFRLAYIILVSFSRSLDGGGASEFLYTSQLLLMRWFWLCTEFSAQKYLLSKISLLIPLVLIFLRPPLKKTLTLFTQSHFLFNHLTPDLFSILNLLYFLMTKSGTHSFYVLS